METEAKNIDKYLSFNVSKRFDFLYENYSVLKPLIKNYREDIIMDVIDMKAMFTHCIKIKYFYYKFICNSITNNIIFAS